MAIRAYGNEILFWVKLVVTTAGSQGFLVMDVDEPLTNFTVALLKVHLADSAQHSMFAETRRACCRIALVHANEDTANRSFFIGARFRERLRMIGLWRHGLSYGVLRQGINTTLRFR